MVSAMNGDMVGLVGSMGAYMGGGMGSSNTTNVDDGNVGETPNEDANNSNGGNGDDVVIKP
jgi:hypothetical protein